jgi:MFS family permease
VDIMDRGGGFESRVPHKVPRNGPQHAAAERPAPSLASLRGLDWFVLFLANVQTGFGPFIAVYLTSQKWTQVDIGLFLTVGGLVSLIGQIPGGALVDAARSEKFVAAVAVVLISVSAFAIAMWPTFVIVMAAQIVHAGASCVLGPAIAAISLGLVGHAAVGERLGRNACFASVGNGVAAAAMGAFGYLLSNQSVFFLTFALGGPALLALAHIRAAEIDPARAHGGVPPRTPQKADLGLRMLAHNRTLLIFAGCAALFHFANAAMLPLMGSMVTMRSTTWATVLVAACIVVPQLIVAVFSPWVGRRAQQWGRRPLLIIGFAALPIRGVLVALTGNPYLLVVVQALDGISAAVLGVMVPLVIADATRGSGHFNLAQGIVGCAVGIGAALSTTFAGFLTDRFGTGVAFLGLAAMATVGLAMVYTLMPETRPQKDDAG